MKIEKDKIGKIINLGGEHIIREYNSDMVVKSPFGPRFILQREKLINKLTSRYKLLKSYFGEYVHDTEIIIESSHRRYVYLQRKLGGQLLSQELMRKPKIARQFQEIVEINKRMVAEQNATWEFFGALGLLFTHDKYIRNCLVLPNGAVRMVDVGVVPLNLDNHHIFLRWLLRWALKRQERLLKSFLEKSRS